MLNPLYYMDGFFFKILFYYFWLRDSHFLFNMDASLDIPILSDRYHKSLPRNRRYRPTKIRGCFLGLNVGMDYGNEIHHLLPNNGMC